MTANEFEPLDANVVKADHDNRQVPVPYQYDYQTAMDHPGGTYSLMGVSAPSSFQDVGQVLPIASPQAGFASTQWMSPTYMQTTYAYSWPSTCQPGTFVGGEDYQTVTYPHVANIPLQIQDSWAYANESSMPVNSIALLNQSSLPSATDGGFYNGGSFSSVSSVGGSLSSTFSSSNADNVYFPDAYPPRAFHNSTPLDRNQDLSSNPPSPENYFASSASTPASMPQTADIETVHSSSEVQPTISTSYSKTVSSRGRKTLPNKPHGGRHTRKRSSPPPPRPKPVVIGRDRAISPAPLRAAAPRHGRSIHTSNVSTATTSQHTDPNPPAQPIESQPRAAGQAQLRPAVTPSHSRLALTATSPTPCPEASPTQSPTASPEPTSPTTTTRHWSNEDHLLVHHRQAGMGYNQIKQVCGFKEAVSTLRGRYRTLTKPKEARVRKPTWTEQDLRLLEEGVRAFSSGSSDLRTAKIPWMRVAAYIKDNGGYHFGNSTCRKRWDELFAAHVADGRDPRRPFHQH